MRPTACDRIAAEVEQQIVDGVLAPGDPLPSEAWFSASHRVSRGTARNALVVLASRELVESVPGQGWFVRAADGQPRASPAARAEAVAAELRRELQRSLQRGMLRPGDPFYGEREVCERFSVGRYAARAALVTLEAEGLLIAIHGRGRFVTARRNGRAAE